MATLRPLSAPSRRGVALAAASAAALAACISTDPETEERLDAAVEQAEDLGTSDDVLADASPAQRRCVEDALGDSDLSPLQMLTDASASGVEARIEMTAIIIDCVPNLGDVDSFAGNFTATIGPALGPDSDVDDVEGACLLQHIVDNADDPAELLVSGASDDGPEVMLSGVEACFDGQSLAVVVGEAGTGPQAYGDDADLDALFDLCESGDDRACDLLFYSVSEGSEYFDLAFDCAGRDDTGGFCTAGIIVDGEGFAEPGSPGLPTLVADCEAGDMIACDTLFAVAAIGSEAENIGFTCGGKIAVGAVPNCRTRFGS